MTTGCHKATLEVLDDRVQRMRRISNRVLHSMTEGPYSVSLFPLVRSPWLLVDTPGRKQQDTFQLLTEFPQFEDGRTFLCL